jgi:hypothetical protein
MVTACVDSVLCHTLVLTLDGVSSDLMATAPEHVAAATRGGCQDAASSVGSAAVVGHHTPAASQLMGQRRGGPRDPTVPTTLSLPGPISRNTTPCMQ